MGSIWNLFLCNLSTITIAMEVAMTGFSEQIERYYDALANTYDDYYNNEISKAEDFLIEKLI